MATFRASFAWARPMALTTPPSVEQSVAGGTVPMTFASSHLWRARVAERVNFADSDERARPKRRGWAWAARGPMTGTSTPAVTVRARRVSAGGDGNSSVLLF